VTQLAALNAKHYFAQTVVSELVELMVKISFTSQAVMLCFIQIFLAFFCVLTWLEGKNKYMCLLMLNPIT
jgi:hypothetical protein